MDKVPTFADLLSIAPIATMTCLVIAVGYWAGWRSRDDHIETLREWIKSLKNDK